jgi:hypothetical protein
MPAYLGPNRDLVLIRLQGDKPEFTGVAAGMSGSPCSIGDRVLGALSYAFGAFSKEPIAGVTPLQDMIDAARVPQAPRPWVRAGVPTVATDDARPIATALSIAGMPPSVRAHFAPWLETQGFVATSAGKAPTGTEFPPLAPGAAVAAVLVSGDLEVAATGTVTAVDGDRVLAFGHPFTGIGQASFPMAHATIVNTLASQARSNKLASMGPIVGEVVHDRLTSIVGRLGPAPKMIPVRGRVLTPNGERTFAFNIARDPVMAPRMAAMAIASGLASDVDGEGRGTVRWHATLTAPSFGELTVEDVYAAESDPNLAASVGMQIGTLFTVLWSAPFGPAPDLAIDLAMEAVPQPIVERIESIHLGQAAARPRDNLEIAVRLVRDNGGSRVERFVLPIRPGWAGQKLGIVAASGNDAVGFMLEVEGLPYPESLDQVVSWLRRLRSNGNLYLMVAHEGPGLMAEVDALPFLPPSALPRLSGDAGKQDRILGLAWEERRPQPGIVRGAAAEFIQVAGTL